jgi:hypothetical protein
MTHGGRKSRRQHRTVLEVIGTTSETGEIDVIAGMGPSSDWFRNIAANPQHSWWWAAVDLHVDTACSTNPRR